jgi:AcrR family transcriptional regulator
MNESDARVQNTRHALRQAFIELVTEQGYENVTVRGLAQRAGIGYKTFYRHYTDKEDLLYRIMGEVLEEAKTFLGTPQTLAEAEKNASIALSFAQKYAPVLRVLFQSPVNQHLTKPLMLFALEEGRELAEASGHAHLNPLGVPETLIAFHFMASSLQLIRWWIENEMPYPVDAMAEYMNELVVRPIWHLRTQSP